MLSLLSLVSEKMDLEALIESLSEIVNNNSPTVKKKLADFVVSLRIEQEAVPKDMEKVRFTVDALYALGML